MMNRRYGILAASAVLAVFALGAGSAAAATNGEKCAAGKMKAAAKYAACRLSADSKAMATGDPVDYSKCDTKQADAWSKNEAKYGVECLTTGDQASVQTDLTDAADCVSDLLAGTPGSCSFSTLPECPPGGVVVDGTCWLMSAAGDSYSTACALAGLAYDNKTDTFAGTNSGTMANCLWIQAELGYPHPGGSFAFGGPLGSMIGCSNNGSAFLVSGSATASSTYVGFARVCGCS